MKLVSTRRRGDALRREDERERFRAAILGGLAPDGGLYLPERLPALDPAELDSIRGRSFRATAAFVALRLLEPVLGREMVLECVEGAFDFDVPVVPLGTAPRTSVLELFHGPTGSFKDIGARFLAQLLGRLRGPDEERVIVLVATSGDTGGAVARAVRGLPGVDAVIVYPEGRLSAIQLRHITDPPAASGAPVQEPSGRGGSGGSPAPTSAPSPRSVRGTEAGGSVQAVPVKGSFDDCQRMVKEILREGSPVPGSVVTSANSVNLGRLLPQVFFHVHGWARCPAGADLVVSVPSGNLGNLTAGLMARRMGVPIAGFVAAGNRNAALPRFLESGELPTGSPSTTLSHAMDVARPSNLERLLALSGGSREALAGEILATRHTDDETTVAMQTLQDRFGVLVDPHTAVGWLGLQEAARSRDGSWGLVVATADPAKFPETVHRATGRRPPARRDWDEEPERDRQAGPERNLQARPEASSGRPHPPSGRSNPSPARPGPPAPIDAETSALRERIRTALR